MEKFQIKEVRNVMNKHAIRLTLESSTYRLSNFGLWLEPIFIDNVHSTNVAKGSSASIGREALIFFYQRQNEIPCSTGPIIRLSDRTFSGCARESFQRVRVGGLGVKDHVPRKSSW
jgi:hypothetical protein